MKTSRIVIIALLAVISAQNSFAQMADYYSGRDIIRVGDTQYDVLHYENWVILENLNNRILHKPITWRDTGEPILGDPRPSAELDELKVNEIINQVFTKEEINSYTSSNNYLSIGVVIDSQTGKSLEAGFILTNSRDYDDPIMLSIPIQKIEQLEELITKDLIWVVTPEWNNASHIERDITLFRTD